MITRKEFIKIEKIARKILIIERIFLILMTIMLFSIVIMEHEKLINSSYLIFSSILAIVSWAAGYYGGLTALPEEVAKEYEKTTGKKWFGGA